MTTIATRTALRNGRLAPSPERLTSIDAAIGRMRAFEGASGLSGLVGGPNRMTASPSKEQAEGEPISAPSSDSDRIDALEARVSVLEKRDEQVAESAPAVPSASARTAPTATLDVAAIHRKFNGKAVAPAARPSMAGSIDVRAMYARMQDDASDRAKARGQMGRVG